MIFFFAPVILAVTAWFCAWVLRDVHGVLLEMPPWFRRIYKAYGFVLLCASAVLAWITGVAVFCDFLRWLGWL